MRQSTRNLVVTGAIGAVALTVLLGVGVSAPTAHWEYAVMTIGGQSVTLNTGHKVEQLPHVQYSRTPGEEAKRQRAILHLNNLGSEGWEVISTTGNLAQGRVFLQRRR